MKLFISWSGEFSKKVAECLSRWIPTIIQTVDVFYSPDDIAKGENWSSRLSDELEQSDFGIVCLTPENILAPWIHFEAGALSKVARSRVSAIMLGISPSDVKGPLARFQNTTFNREDFYRLFLSINSAQEVPLKQAVLEHAFDNSWEKLKHNISAIVDTYVSSTPKAETIKSSHEEHNSDHEALQEILRLTRNFDNYVQLIHSLDHPSSSKTSSDFDISDINTLFSHRKTQNKKKSNSQTVLICCPYERIDRALPIIRTYADPTSYKMNSPENMLRALNFCFIDVRSGDLPLLKSELEACGIKTYD